MPLTLHSAIYTPYYTKYILRNTTSLQIKASIVSIIIMWRIIEIQALITINQLGFNSQTIVQLNYYSK